MAEPAQQDYFKTRMPYDPRRQYVWYEIMRYLQRYFPCDEYAIELGCGYCDAINQVRFRYRFAMDVWEGAACYAAQGVTFVQSPCWAIPEALLGRVDLILASNLLEHLSNQEVEATLASVRIALQPQGILLLIQPNYRLCPDHYFDDPTHQLIFTDINLCERLKKSGFHLIHCEPRFLPFSLRSRWPTHPLLVRLYLRMPWRVMAGQMLVIARRA